MTRALFFPVLAVLFGAPAVVAGQSTEAGPAATIHVDTNLVVVDVVVTDAHQNPVHGLSVSDFTLGEDGHTQIIKTFEEHTADESAKGLPLSAAPKLGPGAFTNDSPISSMGALNIVLLDKLNTPMEDQAYAVNQLSKYLKGAPPGTRIAVVSLMSGRLSLLQGFTSDPELLHAALNSRRAQMNASLFLDDPVSGADGRAPGAGLKIQFRRELTLNALNQLGRYLGGFPGRKNLIWFSASFPISILPDGRDLTGRFALFDDEFRETVNLLAHNEVSVYPIDARGLVGETWFDASNAGAGGPVADVRGLSNSVQSTTSSAATQRFAMTDIADPTGGKVFMNTNDLKGAFAQAIDAGSNYYTLTYSPSSHNSNGQYRKIQIKLDRPRLTLAYRRGYYATDVRATTPHNKQRTNSVEPTPYSAMHAAMVYGAPEPAEIRFEADVRPNIAGSESALAPGNRGSGKVRGPYQRYSVHYIAHRRDIECPASAAEGNVCTVEFVACVYDANGILINTQDSEIKVKIDSGYYAASRQPGLHPGFQYVQEISVPVKGEYYLRVGIHDLTTNRVGAIELPVSVVSVLPPLSESNADAVAGALRR